MYQIIFLFILVYLKSSYYFLKPMKTILISQNEEKQNNWRTQDRPIVKKKDGWTMFLSMETKENQSKCQQKSQELLVWKSKESF